MVRALAYHAEGLGFESQQSPGFFKRAPVHPAESGYLALLRAGEGEGSEGEEMGTTLITLAH